MQQVLFHLPFLHTPIYGYGVMLVIGFIAAMYLAQFLARRSELDPEVFANAAILALVMGIAGARISHVLENLRQYTRPELSAWQNFFNAINIREGGLTYYGGFLLAFPSLVLYALWKKVPIPLGMDIIGICLMVSLGFGRIGCYLNGCCYGAECQLPIAVQFPFGSDAYVTEFNQNLLAQPVPMSVIREGTPLYDYMDARKLDTIQEPLSAGSFARLEVAGSLKNKEEVARERIDTSGLRANPVHPAEIYSSIIAFTIAAFLFTYFTLPHLPGRVFAAMMMIEGVFRYALEMIRVEPAVIGHGTKYLPTLSGQSYSMLVSFILVLGGIGLWFFFGHYAAGRNKRWLSGV